MQAKECSEPSGREAGFDCQAVAAVGLELPPKAKAHMSWLGVLSAEARAELDALEERADSAFACEEEGALKRSEVFACALAYEDGEEVEVVVRIPRWAVSAGAFAQAALGMKGQRASEEASAWVEALERVSLEVQAHSQAQCVQCRFLALRSLRDPQSQGPEPYIVPIGSRSWER